MIALRDVGCRDAMSSLDYWITGDGHLDIEWFYGAYAHEIACELLSGYLHPDLAGLLPGPRPNCTRSGTHWATLWFDDVRVNLRAGEPCGAEEARQRSVRRVVEATFAG